MIWKLFAIIECLRMDEQWGDGSENKLKWAWNRPPACWQTAWREIFGLHLFRLGSVRQNQRWGHVKELWQRDLTAVCSIKRFLQLQKALSSKRWVSLVEKQAFWHDLMGVFIQVKLGQAELMIGNTFKRKKKNTANLFVNPHKIIYELRNKGSIRIAIDIIDLFRLYWQNFSSSFYV